VQALVVGGGIMGLSTAWGLRRMGCGVTVLEQGEIPNLMGSSSDHHRLIRHAYGAELGYTRLVEPAYAAWELLWQTLGVRHYHPTGTLGCNTIIFGRSPIGIGNIMLTGTWGCV